MTGEGAIARLHPALGYHVLNTLGWTRLRPLQENAAEPILEGHDALLLAPTAGGKTEAAIFPLLTLMAAEAWQPVSALYLCPLRALLNNLEPRLAGYCAWLGRRAVVWHGDTTAGARHRVVGDPPDLLLTTPESLEGMLISTRVDPRALFANLRAVVIDEVHSFAGDDRGWHLLAVLDRVERLAGMRLQRIGLSATVGNPERLLNWLQGAGGAGGVGSVVAPIEVAPAEAEVVLDYVGSLENAATVIEALHRGEKRLVFCDSRRRVEELTAELRSRDITAFPSHSSLSADERRRVEQAFAEAQDCVIVATSTLELGVDVGDLDRVIQIDAPSTVASFLQRLGRTGRRAPARANCLFLATSDEALMQAAGLLALWRDGFVEPIEPPAQPLHIAAQQLLALALQEGRVGDRSWSEWVPSLPLEGQDLQRLARHLLDEHFLEEDGAMLFVGDQAERAFGRRHFKDLTSVFTADPQFRVLSGRTEIGTLHPLALVSRNDGPRLVLLAGRTWEVTHVDWTRHQCYVKETKGAGQARWRASPRALSFELCWAMREIALGEGLPAHLLSARGSRHLSAVQEAYAPLVAHEASVVSQDGGGAMRWWTWAGARANGTLGAALEQHGLSVAGVRDQFMSFDPTFGPEDLRYVLRQLNPAALPLPAVTPEAIAGLKFSQALSDDLARQVLAVRLGDELGARKVLAESQHRLVVR